MAFDVCRTLVSCMLFLPDCHASLWSSWPAQLGRCVFGLSPPSPSSSSSLCHHNSCELHRIHPAECISAVHHLLPALLASSAVQIWVRCFYSVIYIQQKPDCTDKTLPLCPSLPCVVLVLRDCSAQNSDATRWECETASSCSWTSLIWCSRFMCGGGCWSQLIWTQDDGPVSHWPSDRGASRFITLSDDVFPFQRMLPRPTVEDDTSLSLQITINTLR